MQADMGGLGRLLQRQVMLLAGSFELSANGQGHNRFPGPGIKSPAPRGSVEPVMLESFSVPLYLGGFNRLRGWFCLSRCSLFGFLTLAFVLAFLLGSLKRLALAMDDHLDFWNKIHRQAH